VRISRRKPDRRVVFFAGPGWEPWSPASIERRGIGGSETALVRVASVLAARAWRVEVYAAFEGLVDDVSYRLAESWDPAEPADAVVAFRRPDAFDRSIAAPIRALWCQDEHYGDALTERRAENMTAVVAVSDWHRFALGARYPFIARKLRTVRNGVSLRRPGTEIDAFPGARRGFRQRSMRCIYSSSPGRGLSVLLEFWPEIRRRAPMAELHIFYGWDVYDQAAETSPYLRAYKVLVLHLLERAGGEAGGVIQHGRVGQPALHSAMECARVWSYPTAYRETSCIGAMEARAAGLPIVTSDLAGLREAVGHTHGILIPVADPNGTNSGGNASPAYRAAFTDSVARLLLDETFWAEQHARALDGVGDLDWSARGGDWEKILA
jgi:glycosyltransferase involved in cell wall biosynthesis